MRKILLVLEDYNEMVFIETLLKKLGFDIESIRTEMTITERLLALSPDLIVCTGLGNKIDARRVSKKNRKRGRYPKILALYNRQSVPSLEVLTAEKIDAALEVPASPRTIVSAVGQLLEIELAPLIAKFEKLPISRDPTHSSQYIKNVQKTGSVAQNEVNFVKGAPRDPAGKKMQEGPVSYEVGSQKQPQSGETRTRRYSEYVQNAEPLPEGGFNRQHVQSELRDIKNYEKEHPEIQDLDKQRKEFVKKLFKKDGGEEEG